MNKNNEKLTPFSQELRRNMTKEERHLWYDFFKKLPITVNRQKVIYKYIADFYIASKKIIIELDGSQHYAPLQKEYDRIRTEYFTTNGFRVLRYTNLEIQKNFNGVCKDILKQIEMRNTSSVPRGTASQNTYISIAVYILLKLFIMQDSNSTNLKA